MTDLIWMLFTRYVCVSLTLNELNTSGYSKNSKKCSMLLNDIRLLVVNIIIKNEYYKIIVQNHFFFVLLITVRYK